MKLPPQSPNLNAHAERIVRTIKESCLDRLIFFEEASRRRRCRTLWRTMTPSEITKASKTVSSAPTLPTSQPPARSSGVSDWAAC